MATLRVQSLVVTGSLSHSPSLVCKKGLPLKRELAANLLKRNNRLTIGQKQTSCKRDRCVRFNCRGSNESDDAIVSQSENIDISDLLLNSSDVDLVAIAKATKRSASLSASRPPKFTTLRPFGEAGAVVMSGLEGSLFELLAANIEATADLKRFETLSGRMAMMAFFLAIGVEVVTGNSIFKGIDVKELLQFAALAGVATLTAAGFAFAWRARSDVAYSLSKGALKLVDAAVDNVIDGLFYDEDEKFKQ